MSYEEIRTAFVDDTRLRTNLRLLHLEVKRIRDDAHRLNVEAHQTTSAMKVDLWLGRLKPELLTMLLPQVFEVLQSRPRLLDHLTLLRQLCEDADRAQDELSSDQERPVFSAATQMFRENLLQRHAPQIVMNAERVLQELAPLV